MRGICTKKFGAISQLGAEKITFPPFIEQLCSQKDAHCMQPQERHIFGKIEKKLLQDLKILLDMYYAECFITRLSKLENESTSKVSAHYFTLLRTSLSGVVGDWELMLMIFYISYNQLWVIFQPKITGLIIYSKPRKILPQV